jgi:hypothetical protein
VVDGGSTDVALVGETIAAVGNLGSAVVMTDQETFEQAAVGIEMVVVNGRVVVDGGTHAGALPGRALPARASSTASD